MMNDDKDNNLTQALLSLKDVLKKNMDLKEEIIKSFISIYNIPLADCEIVECRRNSEIYWHVKQKDSIEIPKTLFKTIVSTFEFIADNEEEIVNESFKHSIYTIQQILKDTFPEYFKNS